MTETKVEDFESLFNDSTDNEILFEKNEHTENYIFETPKKERKIKIPDAPKKNNTKSFIDPEQNERFQKCVERARQLKNKYKKK
jgi:hypothetical protein